MAPSPSFYVDPFGIVRSARFDIAIEPSDELDLRVTLAERDPAECSLCKGTGERVFETAGGETAETCTRCNGYGRTLQPEHGDWSQVGE